MRYHLKNFLLLLSLCTVSLPVFNTTAAQGAPFTETIAFELQICEDLHVLQNPDNMMIAKMAAWQTQHSLLVARNMPFVELKNTSQTSSISEFKMTIGDVKCNFDYASLIEASPGVTFTVDSSQANSADGVPNGLRGDLLTIAFSGFGPGMFVRFQLDLDPDSSAVNALCDYRTSLFDMNGSNPNDNSVIDIKFSTPGLPDPTVLTQRLPDYPVLSPTFTGLSFRSVYGMDHVQPFPLENSAVVVIPEPSSLILLALGIVGLVGLARRRAANS